MIALVRRDANTNSAGIAAIGGALAAACPPRRLGASYSHHVPGRLRLRFDKLRTEPNVLEAVCADIGAISRVRSVKANRLTGSILVEYDPHILPPSDLSEALNERGIACDVSTSSTAEQVTAKPSLGRVFKDRLFECIVERVAVALVAAVI